MRTHQNEGVHVCRVRAEFSAFHTFAQSRPYQFQSFLNDMGMEELDELCVLLWGGDHEPD